MTNMTKIFRDLDSFNYALSEGDVSRVIDVREMFDNDNAYSFDQDLSKWDVSHLTDMGGMFAGARSVNQDLSKWDVFRMQGMFNVAKSFNQDLSNWDVSRVIHMDLMFRDAKFFNQDLSFNLYMCFHVVVVVCLPVHLLVCCLIDLNLIMYRQYYCSIICTRT